ncbi:hypothetical protein D3C85_1096940 [compost metagenome]
MDGRFHDVLQGTHVRPEVEVLEHHRQPGAHALQLPGVGGLEPAQFVGDQFQRFAIEQDTAGVGLLQQVDAAQESAFA